jgi:hypothetical protein
LGTVLMANCAAKASPNLRLFLAFSTILLGLSLASPMAKWQELAGAPAIRYWFFPTLAFAWSLLWCVQSRSQLLQISSGFLLFLMCVGVVRDFRHPAYTDEHFAQQLRRLESASPGTEITIPENPPGWSLRLVKR